MTTTRRTVAQHAASRHNLRPRPMLPSLSVERRAELKANAVRLPVPDTTNASASEFLSNVLMQAEEN